MNETWDVIKEKGFKVGTFNQIIDKDTLTRRYLYYLPNGYESTKSYPLIQIIHGGTINAEIMAIGLMQGEFEPRADVNEFILVYGNCYPRNPTTSKAEEAFKGDWTSYEAGTFKPLHNNLEYFDLVNKDLVDKGIEIDNDNLFVLGVSDGAVMTYRLMEAYPKKYKGAGLLVGGPFLPEKSVINSLYIFYSESDIAWIEEFPDYNDRMNKVNTAWAKNLGIDLPGDTIQFTQLEDKIVEGADYVGDGKYGAITANSRLYLADLRSKSRDRRLIILKSDKGGHNIPHPNPAPVEFAVSVLGFKNRDLNAFQDMWKFFVSLVD